LSGDEGKMVWRGMGGGTAFIAGEKGVEPSINGDLRRGLFYSHSREKYKSNPPKEVKQKKKSTQRKWKR